MQLIPSVDFLKTILGNFFDFKKLYCVVFKHGFYGLTMKRRVLKDPETGEVIGLTKFPFPKAKKRKVLSRGIKV